MAIKKILTSMSACFESTQESVLLSTAPTSGVFVILSVEAQHVLASREASHFTPLVSLSMSPVQSPNRHCGSILTSLFFPNTVKAVVHIYIP